MKEFSLRGKPGGEKSSAIGKTLGNPTPTDPKRRIVYQNKAPKTVLQKAHSLEEQKDRQGKLNARNPTNLPLTQNPMTAQDPDMQFKIPQYRSENTKTHNKFDLIIP